MARTTSTITDFLKRLARGDYSILDRLMEASWTPLKSTAKRFFNKHTKPAAVDEDDVAQIVFTDVVGRIVSKKARVESSREYWRLLDRAAYRRASNAARDNKPADYVSKGQTQNTFQRIDDADEIEAIYQDEEHRQIATLLCDGYSNAEIAEKLSIHNRTVRRRLDVMRDILKERRANKIG